MISGTDQIDILNILLNAAFSLQCRYEMKVDHNLFLPKMTCRAEIFRHYL